MAKVLLQEQLLKRERALIESSITLILQVAIKDVLLALQSHSSNNASSHIKLRANVMLIDSEDHLYIFKHINMENPDELALHWPRARGCCGMAWDDSKQLIADLTVKQKKNQPDWRYPTPEHQQHTSKVKSLISTPIYLPDDTRKVIGILNMDSTEPLNVTKFDRDYIYQNLQQKAVLLSNLLAQYAT